MFIEYYPPLRNILTTLLTAALDFYNNMDQMMVNDRN